jgi:hypothetical protein
MNDYLFLKELLVEREMQCVASVWLHVAKGIVGLVVLGNAWVSVLERTFCVRSNGFIF